MTATEPTDLSVHEESDANRSWRYNEARRLWALDTAQRPAPPADDGEWFDCQDCGRRVSQRSVARHHWDGGAYVQRPDPDWKRRHVLSGACMRARLLTRRAAEGWIPIDHTLHGSCDERLILAEREGERAGNAGGVATRFVRRDDAEQLIALLPGKSTNKRWLRLALTAMERVQGGEPWWVALRRVAIEARLDLTGERVVPSWWVY